MSSIKLVSKAFTRFAVHFPITRNYSMNTVSLMYSDYGDPVKVIQTTSQTLNAPGNNEVLLKMLAASVNPADINTIQGKYPERPTLPAVAGNEGVAQVIEIGKDVKNFSVGDKVIPGKTGLGTWRTHAIFSEKELIKVPKELGIAEAATLMVNPCTAYRMIKDFKVLQVGDTLIQNGSNSACGQNVIQICKSLGINTVNVVRNRPEIEDLKSYLTNLGATYVLTEEEIRTTDLFKAGKLKKPTLALNCVGGKSALEIMRQLDHSGAIVTYGGMSRDPVTIPTSSLIFKNIAAYGFWMTQWSKDNAESEARQEMFADLTELILANKLKAPAHQFVKFDQYKIALLNTLSIQGFTGKKYLLDFE